MRNRKWIFIVLAVVALASTIMWRSYLREDLQEFRSFPHTFITESDIGYDAGKIRIWQGDINSPKNFDIEGVVYWPCFTSPDLPQNEGNPLLFPLIQAGDEQPHTPIIPGLGKPLTIPQIQHAVRYQTADGAAMLAHFAKDHGG